MTAHAGDGFVLLWSGGKDSMLTLDVLHSQSPRRIGCLLTTVVEGDETVTMHGTPLSLIEQQAAAIGLPLRVMRVPRGASNETYETRLHKALQPLLEDGFSTVLVGDIFLEDVRDYRKGAIEAAGATALFPLWERDTTWLAHRFLERGYRALIASIDTTQLDAPFAGRAYDEDFLHDLPDGVDPCGERGAFHTFVTDGPPFDHPVRLSVGSHYVDERMCYARLRTAERTESTSES